MGKSPYMANLVMSVSPFCIFVSSFVVKHTPQCRQTYAARIVIIDRFAFINKYYINLQTSYTEKLNIYCNKLQHLTETEYGPCRVG